MALKQSKLSFAAASSAKAAAAEAAQDAAEASRKRVVDRSAEENQRKKAKANAPPDLYNELVKALEAHAGEQWCKKALALVDQRRDQRESASIKQQIAPFKAAFSAASSTASRLTKNCRRLEEKVSSLQENLRKLKHQRASASSSSSGPSAAAAAEVGQLDAIAAEFDAISCLKPWGKFCVRLYREALELCSKDASKRLVVPFSGVTDVINVNMPTTKERLVLLPLGSPVLLGKAQCDLIAFKFKANDSISSASIRDSIGDKKAATVRKMLSGAAAEAMSEVLALALAKKVERTDFGVFRSMSGKDCVTCHFKANQGSLFFLRSGLLFAVKPMIFIPLSNIQQVESSTATRYFELVITTDTHAKFCFEMIESDEQGPITDFIKEQKVAKRSRAEKGGRKEADDESGTETDSDESAGDNAEAVADEGDNSEEESEDEDFCPDDDDEEFPEEYESGIDESSDEDGDDDDDANDDDDDDESAAAEACDDQDISGFQAIVPSDNDDEDED